MAARAHHHGQMHTAHRLPWGLPLLIAMASGVGVAALQPRLAAIVHSIKVSDDVYVFPPPAHLRALTLGYTAMAADLLWAKTIIEYGTHLTEHRKFADVTRYLDSVIALEPDYPQVYKYAETLILFQTAPAGPADAHATRTILERGLRERPSDADGWLKYGMFLAWLAPSYLTNQDEIAAWRTEGGEAMARAVDLGADPSIALIAAKLSGERMKREVMLQHLQQAYALADDEPTRQAILTKLTSLETSIVQAKAEETLQAIERQWRETFPTLSRGTFLLIGPTIDAAKCAGIEASTRAECSSKWAMRLQ